MLFKIDENLPAEVSAVLSAAKHDARTVASEGLQGSSDATLYAACRQEGRALITLDVDFADIRTYPPQEAGGMIVLRLARLDRDRIVRVMSRIIATLEQEQLEHKLWIVDDSRVRIRGPEEG